MCRLVSKAQWIVTADGLREVDLLKARRHYGDSCCFAPCELLPMMVRRVRSETRAHQ